MKEFKGTPGPWQIGSECVSGDIRITNDEFSMVAIAEAKTGDGFLWSPLTIECNASLIAAAPDLLSALQLILSYHDDGNCQLHREDVVMAKTAMQFPLTPLP